MDLATGAGEFHTRMIIPLVGTLLFALLFVVPAVTAVQDLPSGRRDPGADDPVARSW